MNQSNALLETLKRHNPARVIAYAGDDDARAISVPTRRKKWAQVIEAINARSWSRVELCDKAGAVLAYVENAEPARELEPLDAATGTGAQIQLAERIVTMVARGQREVMSFRDAELSALLAAQGSVVREMAGAMSSLSALYREQVQTAETTGELRATALAHAASSGDDQIRQLIEALPVLIQALPLLRGLLSSGPTPPTTATTPKAKS